MFQEVGFYTSMHLNISWSVPKNRTFTILASIKDIPFSLNHIFIECSFTNISIFVVLISRDGILIPIVTGLTSFYGGIVVFSIVGFMAQQTATEVSSFIQSGK